MSGGNIYAKSIDAISVVFPRNLRRVAPYAMKEDNIMEIMMVANATIELLRKLII